MKTKLYRTITLVLAIVMLLGVTPAFAAEGGSDDQRYLSSGDYDNHSSGQISYDPDDSVDLLDISVEYATRYAETTTRLSFADWENHNYNLVPYNANIAADPNNYVSFGSYWHYGDRTSSASKTNWSELEDGVCYFNTANGSKLDDKLPIPINMKNACDERTITGFFDGNQYLQTVLATDYMYTGGFFTTAPNLKTVICLETCIWGDWIHATRGIEYPSFPKNVTIITGLVKGEMCIGSSNDYTARKIFTNRAKFVEAVKPILASAHLTDRAWSLIPKEFGGQSTSMETLKYEIVSDWARDEILKAVDVGIYTPSSQQTTSNYTHDLCQNAKTYEAARWLISTYEAVCRDTDKPTNYPSVIPATFGRNGSGFDAANKAYTLGIINGDGGTWQYNKTTVYKSLSTFTTREQMAAMLTRLAKACGKTLPTGTMPFTDAMSDWAVPEVSACYNAGMIKGTSSTTFGAYDKVTIEQVIVLCYRAYVYLTTH